LSLEARAFPIAERDATRRWLDDEIPVALPTAATVLAGPGGEERRQVRTLALPLGRRLRLLGE
jgi:hypothetical protein